MLTRTDANSDRNQMAGYIANNRVLHGDELRAALEWQVERFVKAVYGSPARWFMLTINGWELTEQGREGLRRSQRHLPLTITHSPHMEAALVRVGKVERKLDDWLLEFAHG